MELWKVIVIGIVEGITEWLPISSTGHLLLLDAWMPLPMSEHFKEMFFVVVQLGAILAVVTEYWHRLLPRSNPWRTASIASVSSFSTGKTAAPWGT